MKPTLEKLRLVREVYFHDSCPDGTISAMVCLSGYQKILGITPKFYPLQYGTEFMRTLEPKNGQLFIDITPPIERWQEWVEYGPVVLDHHETTRSVTDGLNGIYGFNKTDSGASLAFENVYKTLLEANSDKYSGLSAWKDFTELAMIRDTWKKDHPLWERACSQALAIKMYGSEFLLNGIRNSTGPSLDEIIKLGEVLFQIQKRKTLKVAKGAFSKIDKDSSFKISLFNCTDSNISDVADVLLKEGTDVAVGYFYLFEDSMQSLCASVRTNEKVSASKIAKVFGGGGHERAAGFRIKDAENSSPNVLLSYIKQGILSVNQPTKE